MADVFIAYQRAQSADARLLARHLENAGLSTWFDYQLVLGTDFSQEIERQIRTSKCVVVLWSEESVRSDWVRDEADLALKLSKLLPVLIDNAEPPLGFRNIQHARLSHHRYDADVRTLIDDIRRFVPVLSTQTSKPTSYAPPSTSKPRHFAKQPTAPRTSVFIAHASDYKPRIRPIVELLVVQGFQVWIDKPHELGLSLTIENKLRKDRIRHDADWPEQIRAAVKRSDVVLGFWSRKALEGERRQFQYEMYMGLIQGKLQQCRFDNMTEREIGYPWSFNQMANISTYESGQYHAELDLLMTDFAKKLWWRR